MSQENPKTETGEALKPPVPETATAQEAPKAQSKQQEDLGRTFIPDARGRFDRLKDWAREKVVSLYEKVGSRYEESWMGTVTTERGSGLFNRVEAAFNNKLMKWHEDKSINIAQKLDGAKNKLLGFEQGKKAFEQNLAGLEKHRQMGISTLATEASIKKQMRELEERMATAQADVNKYQSKLESRNNKMAGYSEARDGACNSLINRYDEKLKPWEKQAETIKNYSENLAAEIDRNAFQRDQIKNQINDFQQEYQRFMGRREMRVALSGLMTQLETYNNNINNIKKEKSVMDGRIARAEDRANVYRDKKDKLATYTKRRPGTIEGGEKKHFEPHSEGEEIKIEKNKKESAEDDLGKEGPEKEIDTQSWLRKWNEYLKNEKSVAEGDLINESVWQKWIGRTDGVINFNDFKEELDRYYGIKRLNMPRANFMDNIDDFAKKERQEEIGEAFK